MATTFFLLNYKHYWLEIMILGGRLLMRCSFSYITVIILRCCSLLCQVDKLVIKWSIFVGTTLLHLLAVARSHLSGCASLARLVIIVLTSRSCGSTFWFRGLLLATVATIPESRRHTFCCFTCGPESVSIHHNFFTVLPVLPAATQNIRSVAHAHTAAPKIGRSAPYPKARQKGSQ